MGTTIFDLINEIEDQSLIAEMNVMDALMASYAKEAIMCEYMSEDVVDELFYQEGEKWDKFKDDVNAPIKGKQGENILKKIVMFIPRAIAALIRFIKSKFNKNFVNAFKEDIAEAKEHVKNGDFDELIPGLKSGKMHFDSSDFDDEDPTTRKRDYIYMNNDKHRTIYEHPKFRLTPTDCERLAKLCEVMKTGKAVTTVYPNCIAYSIIQYRIDHIGECIDTLKRNVADFIYKVFSYDKNVGDNAHISEEKKKGTYSRSFLEEHGDMDNIMTELTSYIHEVDRLEKLYKQVQSAVIGDQLPDDVTFVSDRINVTYNREDLTKACTMFMKYINSIQSQLAEGYKAYADLKRDLVILNSLANNKRNTNKRSAKFSNMTKTTKKLPELEKGEDDE